MATNTQKTVDEQLTDIRSELDKIKLYITNSITGITTSVNRVSTDVENKLTATDLAGINAKIETIETTLAKHTSDITDMEADHDELNKYENEIKALLNEVRDVKDKTTSGLIKLSEAIEDYQDNIETEVGEVLDTLGINDELMDSVNAAINTANAANASATAALNSANNAFRVIYTQHPELNITVSLTPSISQYTVGTVPEGGTAYSVKISLSRALEDREVLKEVLTDGSEKVITSPSTPEGASGGVYYTISGDRYIIGKNDSDNKSHTYQVDTNYSTEPVEKTVSIKRAYRTYNFMYGGDEEALIGAINGKSGAELSVVEGCVDVRVIANTTANGTQTISARSSVTGGEKYLYYLVPKDMGSSGSLAMVQSGQTGEIGKKFGSTVSLNGIDHYIYRSNNTMREHPEIKLQ